MKNKKTKISIEKIIETVSKQITPAPEEILKEKKIVTELRKALLKIKGPHKTIEWCGSSARNTHLKGDKDIDLFLMYPETITEKQFETEGLRVAKKLFGKNFWELAYAQHPYVRGIIEDFEVEIVPCYAVSSGAEKKSAVDRTPFHNKYLLKVLSVKQKSDARVLKQFLKGINAYGADLKSNSLPGYGAELLIHKYGNFLETIKAISNWKKQEIIWFDTILPTPNKEHSKPVTDKTTPLTIIDPVDSSRNVASALSHEQFERMIFASKLFLKNPSIKFFFPEKIIPLTKEKLSKEFSKRELIIVETIFPKNTIADIAWGQLRRIFSSLKEQLRKMGFTIERQSIWGDEKNAVMIFELQTNTLPKKMTLKGPFAQDTENIKRFLKGKKMLGKPRTEGNRVVVDVERKIITSKQGLLMALKDMKAHNRESALDIIKSARVFDEKDILKIYKGEFAEHLTQYLKGKERFE